MDSYGLIWTLMGSKQMGFNITWKRIAYIAHMDSYGLIWTPMGSAQMKGF